MKPIDQLFRYRGTLLLCGGKGSVGHCDVSYFCLNKVDERERDTRRRFDLLSKFAGHLHNWTTLLTNKQTYNERRNSEWWRWWEGGGGNATVPRRSPRCVAEVHPEIAV